MKKNIITFLLSASLILFNMSFQIKSCITPVDCLKVQDNIAYISQDKFKGRLTGTLENAVIAQHIKDEFKNNNIHPFNGSYYETFSTKYPKKNDDIPYLKVIDSKGSTIKEYTYGSDYREDMINFKINNFVFDKKDYLILKSNYLHIDKDNNKFLFYTLDNDDLNFRSSFIDNSEESMCIIVSNKTLKDINKNIENGYRISCYIPYSIETTNVNNVIGCIEGKNKKLPPLILSAHFDHVGTDLNNEIFNGAFDNASGTAFILELSKYIKSLGKPERTILFIAFNAEEFGCVGSNNFVNNHVDYLQGAKVFNFDMIGGSNSIPLCIMGGKNDNINTPLISSVSNTCVKENIYFNYLFDDSSDHMYFRNNNIDAITLCDNDKSRIHTTKDKYNTIDDFGINRCFNVISKEIVKYAFNDNPIFIYYNYFFTISFITSFLLSKLYKKSS